MESIHFIHTYTVQTNQHKTRCLTIMQYCKRICGKILNILSQTDESEEELRGDTEDEGIEHDAEEDELEVDGGEDVGGVDGGEEGRRKPSTGSRLSKSGVARELVAHCRFKPVQFFQILSYHVIYDI